MKNYFYTVLLFSTMNAFAAQTSSNDFTIQLDFNKHTNPKDFQVVVEGSCAAYSFLGSTDCSITNNKVVARKDSENAFYVPGFRFITKTSGLMVSSYEVFSDIWLTTNDKNTRLTAIYRNSSDKNKLDLTSAITNFFKETINITTIPAFDFKSSGKLISSKITNSRIKPENIYQKLSYSLLNDRNEVIKVIKWANVNNKDDQEVKNSNVREEVVATKDKPTSLRAELKYTVKYFGKSKTITKVYSFNDLDNIDLNSQMSEVNFEIVDEDLE